MVHLGEQASAYVWENEARRRSAWVGMCVCGDWSILEGRLEPVGEPAPLGVDLVDILDGPDKTLLQQLASRWDLLRSEFGDALFTRISGVRGRPQWNNVWTALALVANQSAMLQQELESAVSDDPELLKLTGVLLWFVTRGSISSVAVADTLIYHLQSRDVDSDGLVGVLMTESERIGLQREDVRTRLENALGEGPWYLGDPALEALAVLFPDHPLVRDAWHEISSLVASRPAGSEGNIHAQTYFAVAYSATVSNEVLMQIERDLDRLEEIGHTYFDNMFTRHVSYRLRRDPDAADMVRDAIINPATSDSRAAQLVSLLTESVGLDGNLVQEVERRIVGQNDVRLAPVVRDHATSTKLSVRTIFMRVADAGWQARSM